MPPDYEINYTRPANEYLERLDDDTKSKITKKLDLIKRNPYRFRRKKGKLRSIWSATLGGDFRILFSICKACHDDNLEDISFCKNYCYEVASPFNVWILAMGNHKELRNFGYGGV